MGGRPERKCSTNCRRLERTLSGVGLEVLCCWLCVVLMPCSHAYQPEEMFLNSLANCGHGDSKDPWHKVDRYSLYNIKDDVSPHTQTGTFLKDCAMVFRSTSRDGRLCIYQRDLDFQNNRVQLRLYDGHMGVDGKTDADKIVSMDEDLVEVEWCTSGRFLTIEMVARAMGASVKHVVIDLLLYHMSSIHRKVYLDTSPSCGSVLELDHSQVNVSNLDTGLANNDVFTKCTLNFVYTGQEANRSLCMIYQPATAHCTFNFTVSVYESERVGRHWKRTLSHEGGCHKPMPERWCSNSSTAISVELHRQNGMQIEDFPLFHAVVLDHHGGAETLPLLFSKTESIPATQLTTIIIVCIIVSTLILVFIIIVVVVLWRRQQTRRPPPPKRNGESSARMLSGRGEETRNGGNHYTDGTHPESV